MDKKDFESLLNKYPDCVSDGKKLKAFLKDLYPDVPKAIVNTLTIMADDGIISEMQMSTASSSFVSARLQKKLEDDYGLSQKIIAECFSLIIYDSAKQTQATNNTRSHENINVSAHTTSKSAAKKENFPKNTTKSGEKPLSQSIPAKGKTTKQTNTNFAFDPKDFEIENGTLKKYKGRSSVVVIPDNMTRISDLAFCDCRSLTSIVISDSVASIGNYAFQGCYNLQDIYITDIAAWCNISGLDNLMRYVSSNKKLYINNELATSITIPDGVTAILSDAFRYCRSLTSITIPDSVTSIGDYAFYNCSGLTSVTIGGSVTSIGNSAFYKCSGLTSITIPDRVTSIGNNAFNGCYRLVEVYNKSTLSITAGSSSNGYVANFAKNVYTNEGGSKLTTDEDGYVIYTDGDEKILVSYHGTETELALPSDITKINQYAFYHCEGLTNIKIPDSVTSIGYKAFSGCKNLTIYCEAKRKPIRWSSDWNQEHRPVVWGVKDKT